MSNKFQDLTGQRFGRLIVKYKIPSDSNKNPKWYCDCDCGGHVEVASSNLKSGNTKSCKCLRLETHQKHNVWDLSGEYGIGYDDINNSFIFDKEDYDKIKDLYWSFTIGGYFYNFTKGIWMHRYLIDCPKDMQSDHINRIKTDNRKINLRPCTNQKNNFNKIEYKNNTSGCRGVYLDKRRDLWMASIKYNYKNIFLGYFEDFDDAVEARKIAESKYFKEFNSVRE